MKKLKKIRIEIDPGHGGRDSGTTARNGEYNEDQINLMIAKELEKKLRNNGATVLMTRRELGKNERNS